MRTAIGLSLVAALFDSLTYLFIAAEYPKHKHIHVPLGLALPAIGMTTMAVGWWCTWYRNR